MRIVVAPAIPARAQAIVHLIPAGGAPPEGLPAPLRAALAERLRQGPVALLPTLGHLAAPWIVLVREPAWNDAVEVRRRGGALARALVAERLTSAVLLPADAGPARHEPFLVGMTQGTYQWDRYLPQPAPRLAELVVVAEDLAAWRPVAASATALGGWIARCRDLVNLPAEDMGPDQFTAEARTISRQAGLRLRVLGEAACRRLGMGCLLAVGRASPRRPRMLVLELPGTDRGAPLAVCGKGVCFDTGGLNIKTGDGMALMRKDMGGAATVLCALAAAAGRGHPRRTVRAYLPLVENAIAGDAFRPGDVLRAMDGTTVEVGNTDAEGRLILADAVCLARKQGAGTILTVATLTGAAMTALGRIHVPLMASDDALAGQVLTAAAQSGEKVWRLPMDAEHRALVRGQAAQLTNAPTGGEAGCITAGAFMAHFAGDTPFAHLDISPASWMPRPWELGAAGATGTSLTTVLGMMS